MSPESVTAPTGQGVVVAQAGERIVGVNLKMYFGAEQTYRWLEAVADLCADLTAGPAAKLSMFVLPSSPTLARAVDIISGSGIQVGAQNVTDDECGAQTGEVSAAMVAELGCTYVLVGHAERRTLFNEDDLTVARKVRQAIRHGLVPVVCIGERIRLPFEAAYEECRKQLVVIAEAAAGTGIVLAYEPMWAIGAGQPAPIDYVAAMCGELRQFAATIGLDRASFLYGGAAGGNIFEALSPVIQGLFLGRFAHDPPRFRDVAGQIAEAGPTLDGRRCGDEETRR